MQPNLAALLNHRLIVEVHTNRTIFPPHSGGIDYHKHCKTTLAVEIYTNFGENSLHGNEQTTPTQFGNRMWLLL